MPRPLSLASTAPRVLFAVFIVLWAGWCVFAVKFLVPLVEQHLVIYYGFAAWVLCILPLLATGITALVLLTKDRG